VDDFKYQNYFLASKHAFLSLLNQSAGAFPANIFTIAFGIFPYEK